jgi:ATP-dependent protease ClpP protease subunit
MQDARSKKIELEQLALNLECSFERGLDMENRIIRLTEDIEEHHFDWFDAALTTLESLNRKTVTLRISSYGGDVYSALGIIGRMQKSKCLINTEGYGKIMSAATAILAAGRRRSISEYAQFMHHETSYEIGHARESEHETFLKESQSLSEKWCLLMSELTGIPKQFWRQRGVGKDFYMDAQQCLKMNIVDEIF